MKIELKPCPFCGKRIDEENELYLPERDWKPSFYDPDSGGGPIHIVCKCGLDFSIGTYEWEEFVKAWNTRSQQGKADKRKIRADEKKEIVKEIDYLLNSGMGKQKSLEHLKKILDK